MEKFWKLRSLYRSSSTSLRSCIIHTNNELSSPRRHRTFFTLSSRTVAAQASPKRISIGCQPRFPIAIGSIRSYYEGASQWPVIRDPEIQNVFKDFMATGWDDLPDTLIDNAQKAMSKNTKDSAGREALADIFRAAEAVEVFGGILVNLRMEIDDFIGMSGKKIGPLSDEHAYALNEVYKRYEEYLDAFGPDEEYLQKKVETELETKMTHLKMRCSFIDTQWEKKDA